MVSIIAYTIGALLFVIITTIIMTVIIEENKLINHVINHDLKDWSSLKAWNYMQEHKHDEEMSDDDRLIYLACKKIIKKRMR